MKISKTTTVEHFDYKVFKPNSLYYIEFFNGEYEPVKGVYFCNSSDDGVVNLALIFKVGAWSQNEICLTEKNYRLVWFADEVCFNTLENAQTGQIELKATIEKYK